MDWLQNSHQMVRRRLQWLRRQWISIRTSEVLDLLGETAWRHLRVRGVLGELRPVWRDCASAASPLRVHRSFMMRPGKAQALNAGCSFRRRPQLRTDSRRACNSTHGAGRPGVLEIHTDVTLKLMEFRTRK